MFVILMIIGGLALGYLSGLTNIEKTENNLICGCLEEAVDGKCAESEVVKLLGQTIKIPEAKPDTSGCCKWTTPAVDTNILDLKNSTNFYEACYDIKTDQDEKDKGMLGDTKVVCRYMCEDHQCPPIKVEVLGQEAESDDLKPFPIDGHPTETGFAKFKWIEPYAFCLSDKYVQDELDKAARQLLMYLLGGAVAMVVVVGGSCVLCCCFREQMGACVKKARNWNDASSSNTVVSGGSVLPPPTGGASVDMTTATLAPAPIYTTAGTTATTTGYIDPYTPDAASTTTTTAAATSSNATMSGVMNVAGRGANVATSGIGRGFNFLSSKIKK